MTGHFLNSQPELVKQMVKEGHIIGNHSWHHPDFTAVSDERVREELNGETKNKRINGPKENEVFTSRHVGFLAKERCKLQKKRALRMYSGHSLLSTGILTSKEGGNTHTTIL